MFPVRPLTMWLSWILIVNERYFASCCAGDGGNVTGKNTTVIPSSPPSGAASCRSRTAHCLSLFHKYLNKWRLDFYLILPFFVTLSYIISLLYSLREITQVGNLLYAGKSWWKIVINYCFSHCSWYSNPTFILQPGWIIGQILILF